MARNYRTAAVAALAACALSACAVFQATPSASDCATTANRITAAQTTLVLTQTTLAAVQTGQVKTSRTITELQNDVTAAQTVLNAVTATYQANCKAATPSQPPAPAQP